MDRRPMLAILVAELLFSVGCVLHAYFLPQTRPQFLLAAALFFVIGAFYVASFLRTGIPARIFSLHTHQIYRLIAATKTSSGKFVYTLENAKDHVFCVASKDAFDGTLPCYVKVVEKENNLVLMACDSPAVKTP